MVSTVAPEELWGWVCLCLVASWTCSNERGRGRVVIEVVGRY